MKVSCIPVSFFSGIASGKMTIKEWAGIGAEVGLDAIDLSTVFLRNHTPVYIEKIRNDILLTSQGFGNSYYQSLDEGYTDEWGIPWKIIEYKTKNGTGRYNEIGTLKQVEDEVKDRIKVIGPGGGFIISPTHFVQLDTSIENFFAFWDAAEKYGKYPIAI